MDRKNKSLFAQTQEAELQMGRWQGLLFAVARNRRHKEVISYPGSAEHSFILPHGKTGHQENQDRLMLLPVCCGFFVSVKQSKRTLAYSKEFFFFLKVKEIFDQ